MPRESILRRVIKVDGQTLRRNVMVLSLLALIVVVFDQWTKRWADYNLATRRHPIPFLVDSTSTAEAVVQDKLGMDEAEAKAFINEGFVVRLAKAPLTDPDAKAYPAGRRPLARVLYVFHNGTTRSPRLGFFYHRDVRLSEVKAEKGGKLTSEDRARVDEELSTRTLVDLVREFAPQVSADGARQMIKEGRVLAALTKQLRSDDIIAGGEILLVQRKNVTIIPGFLRFTYAENPGAAWSFLATASPKFRYWFFTVISIIAVTFLLALAINVTHDKRLPLTAYGLILGGAVGNFIDRQTTNYVIDFVDMYVGSSHWPTYNIADVGISVGVALLLLAMILERKNQKTA